MEKRLLSIECSSKSSNNFLAHPEISNHILPSLDGELANTKNNINSNLGNHIDGTFFTPFAAPRSKVVSPNADIDKVIVPPLNLHSVFLPTLPIDDISTKVISPLASKREKYLSPLNSSRSKGNNLTIESSDNSNLANCLPKIEDSFKSNDNVVDSKLTSVEPLANVELILDKSLINDTISPASTNKLNLSTNEDSTQINASSKINLADKKEVIFKSFENELASSEKALSCDVTPRKFYNELDNKSDASGDFVGAINTNASTTTDKSNELVKPELKPHLDRLKSAELRAREFNSKDLISKNDLVDRRIDQLFSETKSNKKIDIDGISAPNSSRILSVSSSPNSSRKDEASKKSELPAILPENQIGSNKLKEKEPLSFNFDESDEFNFNDSMDDLPLLGISGTKTSKVMVNKLPTSKKNNSANKRGGKIK